MQKEINPQRTLLNNNFLNFVPLICSVMVVQIHSYNIGNLEKTSLPALIIGFFAHGLCTAAVPVFFFISGYLFFRNSDNLQDVLKKQKRRIITVLLPFIAWSSLYFLLFTVGARVLPLGSADTNLSLAGILKGIFFYEYSFPLWYMFQLCIYIALTPLIFYILRNKYLALIILLTTSILGMFITDGITIYIGDLKRDLFLFGFFSYFLLGAVLAKSPTATNLLLRFSNKINIIIPILSLILFSALESLLFEGIIPSFNSRAFVPFVFVSLMILFLKISNTEKTLPKSKVSTMIIYGIHSFVGLLLSRLVLVHIPLPVLPAHFIALILTFVLSYIIGYILKYIKPLYFILSGNR